ncbi:MAG TPA: amidohydrolase family protein [Verrucomicrobiae bacterium]|jgi:L-fuconolactonase|nr:amidohydrolase family protein [Verrucomicrobiae bacterium]
MKAPVIVDSHVHLWNPGKFRYAWLDALPALNRPLCPADLKAAGDSAPVQKFIFVECGCDASQCAAEVDWVATLVTEEPRLKGIVAHASLEKGLAARADLESLAGRPLVKGVRRNLQAENDDFWNRPGLLEGLKLLPGFNFTFDLCVRASQLPIVLKLVRQAPEVTFVLDHFGKPAVRNGSFEPWAHDLRTLAEMPNVVCKISGLITEADGSRWTPADLAPYFEHALECFGPSRVLFGSDWPVVTLAATYEVWVETVMKLVDRISETERKQLFQTNAERIYRV